ncbi:MAG: amidohydrolase [Pseudomonadota bacterium]
MRYTWRLFCAGLILSGCASTFNPPSRIASPSTAQNLANDVYADAHLHTSNYAYQGVSLKTLIDHYMGSRVQRSTVMPIPLQQKWEASEHYADDKVAPNYYLGPKGELYYYAFADAMVAREYEKLSQADKARLDLMITGFNPMDLYATNHIKRVLLSFPGVFSGIGEFTIHKELVSKKVAGQPFKQVTKEALPSDIRGNDTLTLHNPSLINIFNLSAEIGLVATLHNDIYETDIQSDGTVTKHSSTHTYIKDLIQLCKASPKTNVIWAHTGLGRYVKPTVDHLERVATILDACPNWSVDISWDLVQNVIVKPEPGMPSLQSWVHFMKRYQDRILWGSDTVMYSKNSVDTHGHATSGARLSTTDYQAVIDITQPLWNALGPTISKKIKILNYERLFNTARSKVRYWEKTHANDDVWALSNSK